MIRVSKRLLESNYGPLKGLSNQIPGTKRFHQAPRPFVRSRLRTDPEHVLYVIDFLDDFIDSVQGGLTAYSTGRQLKLDVVEEEPWGHLRRKHQEEVGST